MPSVITVGLRGVEHLSSIRETEKRHGVWFVKCGTPPCIVLKTWGDIWRWQYSPVLRSPSSFSSSELCSIEALPAHSHANTQKARADVKHLVLFLFTCKEIMWPVIIISLFCSSMCHKKRVHGRGHLPWWPDLSYMWRRNGPLCVVKTQEILLESHHAGTGHSWGWYT